ncbi:unnamed protein product [Moneuplotes crassus]|uniref:Uncharacterized protein n=1 Tax=Euplotes crassus TaxID=5936 RepID=A0AAD2DB19_EUPCR|nr:unnamed protein product [Moneuplotes crassus]
MHRAEKVTEQKTSKLKKNKDSSVFSFRKFNKIRGLLNSKSSFNSNKNSQRTSPANSGSNTRLFRKKTKRSGPKPTVHFKATTHQTPKEKGFYQSLNKKNEFEFIKSVKMPHYYMKFDEENSFGLFPPNFDSSNANLVARYRATKIWK